MATARPCDSVDPAAVRYFHPTNSDLGAYIAQSKQESSPWGTIGMHKGTDMNDSIDGCDSEVYC